MKKCDIRFKVENDLTTIGAVDESNNIQDITAVTEYKNQFDKEARFFYNYKKEVFAFDGYQLKFNESNLKEFNKIQKNENNYYRTRLGDNLVTVRENLEVFVEQGLNSVENFNFKDKENKLFDKGIPFENISIEQRQALSKQNIIYPANIINKTDLPIEIKNYVNLYNQYISLNSSNRANFATNRSVINENTVLYLDSANKLNYIMAASDLASLEESEVHGNNYLSIALAQRGEQEDVNISESVSDNPVYAKRIKELKTELKELVDKRGRVLPGKERQYNNAKKHLAFLEQSVYDQMKSAIILFLQENKIKVNYSLANSLYEIAIKSDTTADFHEEMQDRFYNDIKLPFAFSYFDSWGMSISELMKKEYNRINTESKKFDGKDGIYIERTHGAKDFNNYIRKNGDRQTKYIWKLIKNVAFKINPKIKFVFEENFRGTNYAEAFTQDQTNFKSTIIEIRASLLQNPKQAAATLVHEIIHSIAHNIIDIVVFNEKKQIHLLTERQINAVKELTKLIKEVQANDKTNKFYGATDAHELLSELTNKEFVEALKEKAPNIFRRIQNFFLNILGIEKNKYRRAEAILKDIISKPVHIAEIGNTIYPGLFPQKTFYKNDFLESVADSINNPVWEQGDNVFNQEEYNNQVNYRLKATEILLSDKAKQVFAKGEKAKWDLNKILTELAISKEQKQLLLDLGIKDREQLALELASNYSYTIEINTATRLGTSVEDPFTHNVPENTSYHSNLTVPGGTNYTENAIRTPGVVNVISADGGYHDNEFNQSRGDMAGWFRSDDKIDNALIEDARDSQIEFDENGNYVQVQYGELSQTGGTPTKTRRILELQSFFQKVRDSASLANGKITNEGNYWLARNLITGQSLGTFATKKEAEDKVKIKGLDKSNENQFLQLLNKDNNWVTFFIKSIIQDSAKKGYEKVLFPKGETAGLIEGFKDAMIKYKELENKKNKGEILTSSEIEAMQQFEKAQKSVLEFYEIKVGNILEKQFGKENVKTITDEFGNQWREITINQARDLQNILLQKLTAEEKAKTIEQITKEHRSITALKDISAKLAHRIGGTVEFENNPNADWKAYNQGMKSVLNEAYMTSDTPFHEILAHPIIRAIKKSKPQLYQSLLKELETGRGKEVFGQVKRDYTFKKDVPYMSTIDKNVTLYYDKNTKTGYIHDNNNPSERKTFNSEQEVRDYLNLNDKYTLEEQQEEAIVTLLGELAAGKLEEKENATLKKKLLEFWKQISDFVRQLLLQDEIRIDELPITTTLNDLAEIMAYGNNKIILPGYKVEYSTPLGNKYDTLEEVNNEIRGLADTNVEVDLSSVKVPKNLKDIPNEFTIILPFGDYIVRNENGIWNKYEYDKNIIGRLVDKNLTFEEVKKEYLGSSSSLVHFIEKNKEYEQSKEIIEQWKKDNNIQYDPEEVYSRGQGFYSSIGAYSNLELDLLLKNLIQHIKDNKKADGEFIISAFTRPIDKRLKHIEGTGDRVRFVIYPKSEHIKWAAPTDVHSGSVWDAAEKVSKDKKSELLGVSFTKAPSLGNINEVSPNLADIIDNLSHVHNELGIELTTNNFRIEYDDDIDYSTKKLVDNINKILDDKYGKITKPAINSNAKQLNHVSKIEDIPVNEFFYSTYDDIFYYRKEEDGNWYGSFTKEEYDKGNRGKYPAEKQAVVNNYNLSVGNKTTGKQPTQTKENTTNIESVRDKIDDGTFGIKSLTARLKYEQNKIKILQANIDTNLNVEESKRAIEETKKEISKLEDLIKNPPQKEYTSQAEINLKVAALKEVARKYPRSLITSKVVPINPNMVSNSEIQYSKVGSKQDVQRFENFVQGKPNSVKSGVSELFDSNPELANIGTPEQYSQYLDTIFPDSKIKDIVYHGSIQQIEQFEIRKEPLLHFGTKNAASQRGGVLHKILLNIKELQTIKDGMWFLGTDEGGLLKELLDRKILTIEEVRSINEAKNKAIQESPYFHENYRMALPDGEKAGNQKLREILKDKNIGFEYVNESEDKGSTSYAVPSPEQIHILGSNKDIENFANFVVYENSDFSKIGNINQFRDYIMSKNFAAIEEFLVVNNKIDRKC